jgi:hypothetical protein
MNVPTVFLNMFFFWYIILVRVISCQSLFQLAFNGDQTKATRVANLAFIFADKDKNGVLDTSELKCAFSSYQPFQFADAGNYDAIGLQAPVSKAVFTAFFTKSLASSEKEKVTNYLMSDNDFNFGKFQEQSKTLFQFGVKEKCKVGATETSWQQYLKCTEKSPSDACLDQICVSSVNRKGNIHDVGPKLKDFQQQIPPPDVVPVTSPMTPNAPIAPVTEIQVTTEERLRQARRKQSAIMYTAFGVTLIVVAALISLATKSVIATWAILAMSIVFFVLAIVCMARS